MLVAWFEKHYRISLVVVFIIASIIFYYSSKQLVGGGGFSIPGKDMIYHFCSFFFLNAFLLMTLVRGKIRSNILPATLMCVLYAFSDEIHQYFVPGRNMDFFDIMLDSGGAILASIVYISILNYRVSKLKRIN